MENSIKAKTTNNNESTKQKILSTLTGSIIFIGLLSAITLFFNDSLFLALGIGVTALFSQLARHFKKYSIPWFTMWTASLGWLSFSLLNIEIFLAK